MGGGVFSSATYSSARDARLKSGIRDFDYDHRIKTGKAKGIHVDLDPKKVAGASSLLAGKIVRESRDSDEHPNSTPIAMIFDVTGSMGTIPVTLQKKLCALMDVIIAKTELPDPQILVGAVGDTTCDHYPFQIGQFESDNRFDDALRNIILEAGGGGQNKESYGLAWYWAARHTATDAWEKRGKKGYLITMGDEMPWPTVPRDAVRMIFGASIEADLSIEECLAQAQERWEIFHIHAEDGSYPSTGRGTDIVRRWRELLGERLVLVQDSNLVCEVIAGLILMLEQAADLDRVVKDVGVKGRDADVVKNALVPVSGSVPAHVATGGLPAGHGKAGGGLANV